MVHTTYKTHCHLCGEEFDVDYKMALRTQSKGFVICPKCGATYSMFEDVELAKFCDTCYKYKTSQKKN